MRIMTLIQFWPGWGRGLWEARNVTSALQVIEELGFFCHLSVILLLPYWLGKGRRDSSAALQ